MPSLDHARARTLKTRLAKGDAVSACWVTIVDPAAIELVADTGFDIALIDSEHAPWDPLSLQTALLAFRGSATVPILRTRTSEDGLIKQAIDMGFDGLLIPNVASEAMARAVVAAAKYPPMGTRGYGPRRASSYFRDATYRDEANETHIVMVQIEHRDAVAAADSIMSTAGIDATIIGPNDLSGSFGRLGDFAHPEVSGAIEETLAAAQRTCTPVGYGVPVPPSEFKALRARGFQIISVAADLGTLASGLTSASNAFRDAFADR